MAYAVITKLCQVIDSFLFGSHAFDRPFGVRSESESVNTYWKATSLFVGKGLSNFSDGFLYRIS